MVKELKLAYEFDFVFDGQKVFRELLHVLANPGTIGSIGHQAGKFAGSHQALMALGCTLLDNEETMYVEKNPVLSADLHSLTLCHETDLDKADYIFLSSEMNYGSMEQILKNIKHGTYADPQQSATVFSAVHGAGRQRIHDTGGTRHQRQTYCRGLSLYKKSHRPASKSAD